MCLSSPACISDRGTPGNRLQRGTVSALPSVYRASCSALRCDRGMPGGIAMCQYYTCMCGVSLYGAHGIEFATAKSEDRTKIQCIAMTTLTGYVIV